MFTYQFVWRNPNRDMTTFYWRRRRLADVEAFHSSFLFSGGRQTQTGCGRDIRNGTIEHPSDRAISIWRRLAPATNFPCNRFLRAPFGTKRKQSNSHKSLSAMFAFAQHPRLPERLERKLHSSYDDIRDGRTDKSGTSSADDLTFQSWANARLSCA